MTNRNRPTARFTLRPAERNRVNLAYPQGIVAESSAIDLWRADDCAAGIAEARAFASRGSAPAWTPDLPRLDDADLAALYVFGPRAIGRETIPLDTLLETRLTPKETKWPD